MTEISPHFEKGTRETLKHLRTVIEAAAPGIVPAHGEQTSLPHLAWMCEETLASLQIWDADKSSRWLGFVHGNLAGRGLVNMDEEIVRSRKAFQRA